VLTLHRGTRLRALRPASPIPNYRIFADRDAITVFNAERFVRGTNIRRSSRSSTFASRRTRFTWARELARASLAMTLGKTYRQEGALSWVISRPPTDAQVEHVA
jgi:hypothetical protein